jgi:hypothetical protein
MSSRRQTLTLTGIAFGIAISIATLWPGPVSAQSTIVKEGQAQAEIVIADHPPRMVNLAAEELQTYLRKISGARLAITNAPTRDVAVQIYVGKSPYTDKLGISDAGLTDGAFRVRSGSNWLALVGHDADYVPREPYARHGGDRARAGAEWDKLTGARWAHPGVSTFKAYNSALQVWCHDERGSLHAVYDFLRSLGVRWYLPGDAGEIVPTAPTIVLPTGDKDVHPAFAYREMMFYGHRFFMVSREDALWQLRLGLNWTGSPGGHGIDDVIHHDNTRKAHPEFYLMVGDKRDTVSRGGKPCLSAEGLARSNVEYGRFVFEHYGQSILSVMPTDAYVNLCQCDACKGKDTPERGSGGNLSDYVWGYMNRVATELYKTHPDRRVSCYAYGAYLLPPLKIDTFSSNVVVGICQGRSSFGNAEIRQKNRALRAAWLAKIPSQELYIWEYYLQGRPGRANEGLPAYFPHLIAEDIRSLKGIGKGEGIEVYTTQGKALADEIPFAINQLNCYVTAWFWWNPDQDVDALLEEYYTLFFGPARDEMKAFIEYSEANWMEASKDPVRLGRILELLAVARKKAPADSVYAQRIAVIAGYVKPLEGLRAQLIKGRTSVSRARGYIRDGAPITMDGKLDEPFWQNMAVYGLSDLVTGAKPKAGTSFKIARTATDVYFGIFCQDPDTNTLAIGTTRNEDGNLWNGDCIELLLETQSHSYYQLAINPAGAICDADRKDGLINSLWASQAQVATHIGDGGWGIEVRIPVGGDDREDADPLNGVSGRVPSQTYPWYFNLCRQRIRDDGREFSASSPTGKPQFHDALKFGELYVR